MVLGRECGVEEAFDGQHVTSQLFVLFDLKADLVVAVHDSRVVAVAQSLAYGEKRGLRLLAGEVHGHLTGECQMLSATGAA